MEDCNVTDGQRSLSEYNKKERELCFRESKKDSANKIVAP